MKVIIPLAGKGTRLRPHTHITPKPMLKVAGKPVMAYILEDLERLGSVDQVVYITGHLKEKVEEYTRKAFSIPAVFIEQKVQDGTAGAVELARPYVDQPVLIIFVDTIFDADLSVIDRTDADGIIWVKTVEDYQRFGVVVTDADGHMTKIVEKPKTPISKRANIGLYYIRNWKLLYEGIAHVLKQPKNQGEYFLTDAFQYMIDKGARIKEKGRARVPAGIDRAQVIEPVYIEDGVTLVGSRVGPNVSLGAGTVIENATIRDTITGDNCRIANSTLSNSLIGDEVVVTGVHGEASVGSHSEVRSDTGK